MISNDDVLAVKKCLEGTQRIGDPSPDEKIRRILKRIFEAGRDEADDDAYDDGYEDGFEKGYGKARHEYGDKK